MSQPLIIIADQTLAIQAQLGDLLATDASVVSAVKPEQLEYWLEVSSQQPDLLILERSFCGVDYRNFCSRWFEHPNTRDCDILILGERKDEYEVEALLAGAVDYLVKPLNPVLTLARVKSQLKRRHEIARLEALSSTDGLTGVANRRYLDQFLAAEWGRAQRGKTVTLA